MVMDEPPGHNKPKVRRAGDFVRDNLDNFKKTAFQARLFPPLTLSF
jgi:hypothetical protein